MPSTSPSSKTLIIVAGIALGLGAMALGAVNYNAAKHKDAPKSETALVKDEQQILTTMQQQQISQYHAAMLKQHDIDLRVLTAETDDISRFAAKKFEEEKVGSFSKSGRGLLLVIAPQANKARVEVGRSLEGIYTDAFISYIENRQMVHFFKAGKVAEGILATTEMVVTRAQQAAKKKEFEPPVDGFEASTGAGAQTNADIGAGKETWGVEGKSDVVVGGSSAADTLHAYIKALEDRNARADLSIYTKATQAMFADWVVTPAQMDNEAKNYRQCKGEEVRESGDLAVVRFDVRQRQCAPYFLRKEDGVWKLDFTMMQTAIVFNTNNEWRLKPEATHDFGFAFTDWRFDKHGFAHPGK